MKKILIVFLAVCLLFVYGCSSGRHVIRCGPGDTTTETSEKGKKYSDGVIGEKKSNGGREGGADYEMAIEPGIGKGVSEAEYYSDGGSYSEVGEVPFYPGENGQIEAGTLTAGEIKDVDDLKHWISLWNEEKWDNLKKERGLYAENVVFVSAEPLTAVKLIDGDNVIYSAIADIHGKAFLIFDSAFKGKTVYAVSGEIKKEITLTPGASAELVQSKSKNAAKLDFMLMIDTTGSMGDELEYIKVELKDVIERVRKEQNIDIRVSVNFYRDEGDEYIVKYYDFREEIDDCITILSQQRSDGGGDYPEAVHTAINNVLQHSWREDAVKLCFFVLDAPPHPESEIQNINSEMLGDVTKMAAQGIRFISVVSSGANIELEVLMRSFAVMTGGTYLFLTNDSGIGGDHQEPTDADYVVEPLNDCMVRVIMDYVFNRVD